MMLFIMLWGGKLRRGNNMEVALSPGIEGIGHNKLATSLDHVTHPLAVYERSWEHARTGNTRRPPPRAGSNVTGLPSS